MVDYLIGVDGGGSGTRAIVQARGAAAPLGEGRAGPSALGQGIAAAWRQVVQAIAAAFGSAGLAMPPWRGCALAAALSGASHAPWRAEFLAGDPGFAQLAVETDTWALLRGAHGGRPGAIVVAGTGSMAEALLRDGRRRVVGGWGFPVGDEGSGGWLGWHAVRHAQAALDGRAVAGPLAHRIWQDCGATREQLQAWCLQAGQFAYAQRARAVFECEAADPVAAQLLLRATAALEDLALAIDPPGQLPLAVGGSIGERLAPRLAAAVQARRVVPQAGAAAGALAWMQELLRKETEEAW